MTLPSPLELTLLGTALLLGGGAAAWFLPLMKSAAIKVMLLGVAVLAVASAAYSYERMGEAKIQVKLDAVLAQLKQLDDEATQFKSDAIAARDRADADAKRKSAAVASHFFGLPSDGLDATVRRMAGTRENIRRTG